MKTPQESGIRIRMVHIISMVLPKSTELHTVLMRMVICRQDGLRKVWRIITLMKMVLMILPRNVRWSHWPLMMDRESIQRLFLIQLRNIIFMLPSLCWDRMLRDGNLLYRECYSLDVRLVTILGIIRSRHCRIWIWILLYRNSRKQMTSWWKPADRLQPCAVHRMEQSQKNRWQQ